MFGIYAYTNEGEKKEFSVINRDYAINLFKMFISAFNLKEVIMVDGLTGEILYLYTPKGWEIFNSQSIGKKYMI